MFHSLRIKKIKKETSEAVSIVFDVPDNLKELFKFKAGQYVTLRSNINGKEVRRDYSLCTNPNSNILKVVVKKLENGVFSSFANDILKEGDKIDVSLPNGRFVFDPSNTKGNIALFAAGSGITPIMSILKSALEDTSIKVLLVFGNKSPQSTIFLKEILELKKRFENRFLLKLVYSQNHIDNSLFGRIDKSVINFTINNEFSTIKFLNYYLCGPEDMVKTVSNVLVENGVDASSIFYELFTTSTQNIKKTEVVNDGKTKVTVFIDDEELEFEMPQDKTLLEAALENNVDAPYSCQGGVCSSCIAKVKKGKAIMRVNNILTDSELEEGYILTCQAVPETPNIYIDYDDV